MKRYGECHLEMLILDEPDKGLAPIGFDILSEMSMA